MSRHADNLADVQWVAQCARRLREQWPHAELWHGESLRPMAHAEAAGTWLRRGIPTLDQIGAGAQP